MASFIGFLIMLFFLILFFHIFSIIFLIILSLVIIWKLLCRYFMKKLSKYLESPLPKDIKIISVVNTKNRYVHYVYSFEEGKWMYQTKDGKRDKRYKNNFYRNPKFFLQFDSDKYEYKICSKNENSINLLMNLLDNKYNQF